MRTNLSTRLATDKAKESTFKTYANKGFALISTIMVMSLLLLLSVAMLSFSSVETTSSQVSKHQEVAKANAKLALMEALGKLQEIAGPDRRVTFNASVFDDTPETEGISGVMNPHWVGVARTDGFLGESEGTGIIQEHDGALIDRRDSSYDRKSQVLSWLVSGENVDPETALDDKESIRLFKTDKAEGDVRAPLVEVNGAGGNGAFAYWVSDESVKARYASFNPRKNLTPNLADNDSIYGLLASQQYNFEDVFPKVDELDAKTLEKLYSNNQTELADIGFSSEHSSVKEQILALGHDVTPYSNSILTDAVNGGVKKNLTAFLDSSGSVPTLGSMTGIDDNSPILVQPNRETVGPKFGSLRDWYKLKDEVSGTLGNRTLDARLPNSLAGSGVDPTRYTKQPIHPVVASAHYYGNYTFNRTSKEIIELIYPRVVMWNPYNVKMESGDMYVELDFRMNNQVKFTARTSTGLATTFSAGINYNFNYNKERRLIFYIPPTVFEPGQALTFTTPEQGANFLGKGREFVENRGQSNPLSCTADPTDLHCYYRTKFGGGAVKKIPNDVNMNQMSMSYSGTVWDGNRPGQNVNIYGSTGSSDPEFTELGNDNFPKLQQVHLDNFSRGNNGRWMPFYPLPGFVPDVNSIFSSKLPPKSLIGFGFRFKNFYESFSNRAYGQPLREPWYYAPIIHSNVRAGRSHRWPSDNMFGIRYNGTSGTSGARAHLYTYGPYAQERQFREWNDPVWLPKYQDGKYISSVFQDNSNTSSNERTTLFDVPAKEFPITSLANLQHVQLTPYVWHPSYIIGTGFANPSAQLEKSAPSESEADEMWNQKVNQFNGQNNNVHMKHLSNGNPLVYDIAYETNYHLWDRYFVTGLSDEVVGWSGGVWSKEAKFPNPRLQINQNIKNSDEKVTLTDFHKAAQALINEGALNTNSTSIVAWKAILRSFNDLDHPSRNGNGMDVDLKHPFSRLLVPDKPGGVVSDTSDGNLWSGYRKLSDDEIDRLAKEIVVQVKKRAPFIGLGDFVNRRLSEENATNPELPYFGTIQAAINKSLVNDGLDASPVADFSLPDQNAAENFEYGADYWGAASRHPLPMLYGAFHYIAESSIKTISEAAAAPSYMTQADVLQKIGANLTVRGDTFVVRTYGESRDGSGIVKARSWAEAIVQRTIEPVNPDVDQALLNPVDVEDSFGRKFRIISFRWLSPAEIL